MPQVTTRQAAIAVLTEDIRTAHEILDYSKVNGQVAHTLRRAGTQSHLFGLARQLADDVPAWSKQKTLARSQILGGITRAVHALTDPAGCMFYQYELRWYTAQELAEIDPPRPEITPPANE